MRIAGILEGAPVVAGRVRGHVFVCRDAFVPVEAGGRYVTAEELDVLHARMRP
jgi:hypothetical protein